MYLGEIITFLKQYPEDQVAPIGFGRPHSFRGYYDQLAFEVVNGTTVGKMLQEAESCVGRTFEGYKGGGYTMDRSTECWLAEYGSSDGDTIGRLLLTFMLGEPPVKREHNFEMQWICTVCGKADDGTESECNA